MGLGIDLTGSEQRPEQHCGGLCRRQHGLRLDPFDREPVHVRRAVLIAFKKSHRGFIKFNEAPARHARISRELIQFGTDSHGRDARPAARCFAASALAALPALRAFTE